MSSSAILRPQAPREELPDCRPCVKPTGTPHGTSDRSDVVETSAAAIVRA
ncbi:hypothetical protein TIFTF001_053449 [Ficus carica]|uniref:Uncharacterized protein n=1 Tax=Ficus carica TaxID=3494 RepID=A0AA88ECD9_FICCA|nr:hypothetical protein TIFTF001_053449 [Ficus carica]